MNQSPSAHHSSIGRDFLSFGPEAVHAHRVTELRENLWQRANARGTTQPVAEIRHRLGGLMISLGSWLAGATTPTAAPAPERPLAPGR